MSDELILSIIFPAILFIISFMGKIKTYWRHRLMPPSLWDNMLRPKKSVFGSTEILYWPGMKKQRNFM